MKISYKPPFSGVYSVEIIIISNDGTELICPLTRGGFREHDDNGIKEFAIDYSCNVEIDVTNRKKFIYKFVINGMIRLNDPFAALFIIYEGEVYSVRNEALLIDKNDNDNGNGAMMPTLEDFVISDRVHYSIKNCIIKKNLNSKDSMKVTVGIGLDGIMGTHSLSFIWHQPDGRVFRVEERAIDVPSDVGEVSACIWFWINFSDIDGDFANGVWCVEVLLDGKIIKTDYLMIYNQLIVPRYQFDIAL